MLRIGIDLGGTKIAGVLLDENLQELSRIRVATPKGDYHATIQAICSVIAELEKDHGQQLPVGIGIPGTISPWTGVVKNANSTWLIGKPFHKDLALALSREIKIANDANCLALSEAIDGAGAGAKLLFAIIIGTGCGAGIAIDGKVHSGSHGISGEWGHNTLSWRTESEFPGPKCYCGRRGCIETFVSGTGFENEYYRQAGVRKTGAEIVAAVKRQDVVATNVLNLYENRLARGIAMIVNIMDPDVIVLGGGMSKVQQLYESLPKLVPKWTFGNEFRTPIRPAKHGDASGVRGAAMLWPSDI